MKLGLSPKKIIVGASKNNGLLAQSGEHRLDKAEVPGSKPGQATKNKLGLLSVRSDGSPWK